MASITHGSLSKASHERPSSSSGEEATGTWFVVLVGMLGLAVLVLGVSLAVPVTAPTGVTYVASQSR